MTSECAQCDPPLASLDPVQVMRIIPAVPEPNLIEVGNYSQELVDLLSIILVKDPKARLSCTEILNHNLMETQQIISLKKAAKTYDVWDSWSWEESLSVFLENIFLISG